MNIHVRGNAIATVLAGSLLLTAYATSAIAADLPPSVEAAFKAMETTPSDQWGYKVTTIAEDESSVEHFDPSSAKAPWTLLQINGAKPDEADLDAYQEKIDNLEKPYLPDDFVFSDLVDENTLTLESEDQEKAHYIFSLAATDDEEDEAVLPFLSGRLTINKAPLYVSSAELKNKEAFSPELGVNVKKMHIQITFEPLGSEGPFFLKSVTEEVEAKAFGIMNVAETEAIRISDYVHVGQ